MKQLSDYSLVLASSSPRRRDILLSMGLPFMVRVGEASEEIPEGTPPSEAAVLLARRKALSVAAEEGEILLAADTVVELDGRPLGKPTDAEDAASMLRALSGRTHAVHTGVAVLAEGRLLSGLASSRVSFRPLSEEEILAYVASGEPSDKAGAYAIQGGGAAFVSSLSGDRDTVIGLPSRLVLDLLREVLS